MPDRLVGTFKGLTQLQSKMLGSNLKILGFSGAGGFVLRFDPNDPTATILWNLGGYNSDPTDAEIKLALTAAIENRFLPK